MSKRTVFVSIVVVVLAALLVAACGGGGGAAPAAQGDAKAGAQTWATKACVGCHGANGEGGVGPKLAGTALGADQFKASVRNGKGAAMPKFSSDQVSDTDIANIYAWLKSQ